MLGLWQLWLEGDKHHEGGQCMKSQQEEAGCRGHWLLGHRLRAGCTERGDIGQQGVGTDPLGLLVGLQKSVGEGISLGQGQGSLQFLLLLHPSGSVLTYFPPET